MKFEKSSPLRGTLTIPGDKSISHRAVMFGALANGITEITNFLSGADCLSTISCFQKMGIDISISDQKVLVHGKGLNGLVAPTETLDVGNSGTTTRLICGILAGQSFSTRITGDSSIQSRPMKRIITPLSLMGADLISERDNGCAPLRITGKPLTGIHYQSPVASAQVKSCVLLAGLYADSETSVSEPALSRDHTERMLSSFGASIKTHQNTATILPQPELVGQKIEVPGDISSAAYFIAAALIVPGSEILLKNVGINPTRDGILKVIEKMGGDISCLNARTVSNEPVADLLIRHSALKGTVIEGDLIPTLIDELPILAVIAAFADGTTIIRNAEELRVKESDRLTIMVENLSAMGVNIVGTEDGMVIHGGNALSGTTIDSHMDHRIAMSFAIAGLAAEGSTVITNDSCVNISYPNFYSDLFSIM